MKLYFFAAATLAFSACQPSDNSVLSELPSDKQQEVTQFIAQNLNWKALQNKMKELEFNPLVTESQMNLEGIKRCTNDLYDRSAKEPGVDFLVLNKLKETALAAQTGIFDEFLQDPGDKLKFTIEFGGEEKLLILAPSFTIFLTLDCHYTLTDPNDGRHPVTRFLRSNSLIAALSKSKNRNFIGYFNGEDFPPQKNSLNSKESFSSEIYYKTLIPRIPEIADHLESLQSPGSNPSYNLTFSLFNTKNTPGKIVKTTIKKTRQVNYDIRFYLSGLRSEEELNQDIESILSIKESDLFEIATVKRFTAAKFDYEERKK